MIAEAPEVELFSGPRCGNSEKMILSNRPAMPVRRSPSSTVRRAIALLFCAVLALATGCGSSESPATDSVGSSAASEVQEYALRGKVIQLEPENQAATIEHEEIPGWMDAMTMRFPIKDRADFDKLAVGAEIEATVFVSSDGFLVADVDVIENAQDPAESP